MKFNNLTAVIFISLSFVFSNNVFAQVNDADSSLLEDLESTANADIARTPVKATFKGDYVVSAPSVQTLGKGVLNFMIMHRFGKINDGVYQLFGLDNASIRFGLDYGITDDLTIGVGRSSFLKTFDGYAKYKFLKQTVDNSIPISAAVYTGLTMETQRYDDRPAYTGANRLTYFTQALFARKFGEKLSLQLAPTWLHFNMVPTEQDKNDVFAGTISGRFKFTKRTSINAEYSYFGQNQIPSFNSTNALSLGVDIETGGHVFQLIFSNSQGMNLPNYLARTTDKWSNSGIYFGFNISRVFNVGGKKEVAAIP